MGGCGRLTKPQPGSDIRPANQTTVEWAADLEEAAALRPEHVSLYGLIVEEKTEFGRRYAVRGLPLPDEDT